MTPETHRRRQQAVLLLIVAPVGILGFIAQLTDRPTNPGLAVMFAIVTPGAIALGVWRWRRKVVEEPGDFDDIDEE